MPGADTDSKDNLLVVQICTRFKKIMKFKILYKNKDVKVGMWKCSGTIQRNVCWIL